VIFSQALKAEATAASQAVRLPARDKRRYPDEVKRSRSAHLSGALLLAAAVLSMTSASNNAQSSPAQPGTIRIVLVGDSTVTDDSGWGTGFRHLVTEAIDVVNTAANGRSSKSFIDEGRWAEALAKRGQYYLIQFGHNDEPGKGPERETDPQTTYRTNMARYVDDVRGIGGTPILVTSLVRRLYKEDGTIRTTQTPYVEAVRALAAEKQIPLVDLHAISLVDAEDAGDDVWADLSPRDEKGQVDRTHLNAKGSGVVGRMVVEALRSVAPALAPMLRVAAGAR
jgi:pectinesterase